MALALLYLTQRIGEITLGETEAEATKEEVFTGVEVVAEQTTQDAVISSIINNYIWGKWTF